MSNGPYLDKTGLARVWSKTKGYVNDSIPTDYIVASDEGSATDPNPINADRLGGKTAAYYQNAIKDNADDIDVLDIRLDNLASTLTPGSTSGDAELIDIRVGADGKTYNSAGTAVRTQISDLKENLMQFYSIENEETFDAKTGLPLNRFVYASYTKLLPTFSNTNPPDLDFTSSNMIRIAKYSLGASENDYVLEIFNASIRKHVYLYVVNTSTYRWVVPDTTLTTKAHPADSYSVGNAINSAKAEAITNLVTYDMSVNKFDRNNPLIASGYWNGSGKQSHSDSRVTHPIYVLKGIEYKANIDTSFLGNNNNVTRVDSSMNRITSFTGTINNGVLTFTPDFTGYVSLNIGKFSDDVFRVSEGSQYPTNGQLYTPETAKETNPLIGKKLSVNGDSICAGAGYTGGYAKIIGLRNNMTVENIAENGATITSGTLISGENRHWISTSIGDMASDADYVILEGGVNDDENVIGADKIGTIDPTDYTGPFDTTTFCGALDYMFSQVLSRFPTKKIGFIITHKAVSLFNSSTTYSKNRYPFVVQACKKWGIPYLDLNSECPPLNYISALKSSYTKDGDGWHPNEAGYRLFYVPKIEAWMKTL